jgi:Zn-dependent protease with chaperone function
MPNRHGRRPFLQAKVAQREQAHRRTALLGVAALIALTAAPVFGHHIAAGADTLLAGLDHLGALCLIALHHILAPVHDAFHLIVLVGLGYAAYDRLRAGQRMRTILHVLRWEAPRPGDAFWRAAEAAPLDPQRIRVVDRLPNPAFTTGLWHPEVYVARSLADRLTHYELAAVIAHEGVHVRRRDPLRLSAVRFLARTLFWLPALARLADDLTDQAELTADDVAAGRRPLVLATALIAIASGFRHEALPEAAVGALSAGERDLLEHRVRRLAGEATPVRSHVTRRSIWLAALALVLLFVSNVAVVHPLPEHGPMAPPHCTQHAGSPLSHLFCRHGAVDRDCPHAGARVPE